MKIPERYVLFCLVNCDVSDLLCPTAMIYGSVASGLLPALRMIRFVCCPGFSTLLRGDDEVSVSHKDWLKGKARCGAQLKGSVKRLDPFLQVFFRKCPSFVPGDPPRFRGQS